MSHYDVLEVSPKASLDVIRAAYKSLMQRYHPDKNGTESAERASLIAQAYEVLSNPDKRLAYDRELNAQATLATRPGPTRQPSAGRPVRPQSTKPLRFWYAWLLIVSIVAAGAMILGWAKRNALPTQSVQASGALAIPGGDAAKTALNAPPMPLPDPHVHPPVSLSERTVSAFMTRLSIDLSHPDGAGIGHVLVIPNLGLRVAGDESARWVQAIEAQRPALMQQLLITLAAANYEELIKAGGEVYLKRLIEDAVSAGVGLDAPDTTGQALEFGQTRPRFVRALLPLSFSVH